MFPDSKIASQFRLGETKCAYTILYGIAPYVADVLNDTLQEVPLYSLSFDESYNPKNTPRVFHVETTWKQTFPCHFNVEYTWSVCKEPPVKKVTKGPFDSLLG